MAFVPARLKIICLFKETKKQKQLEWNKCKENLSLFTLATQIVNLSGSFCFGTSNPLTSSHGSQFLHEPF